MRNFFLIGSLVLGLMACGKSEADEALAKMEGFKNDMCACKDKECVEKVGKEMEEYGKKFEGKKPEKTSKEQEEKAAKIAKEMGECMMKHMK